MIVLFKWFHFPISRHGGSDYSAAPRFTTIRIAPISITKIVRLRTVYRNGQLGRFGSEYGEMDDLKAQPINAANAITNTGTPKTRLVSESISRIPTKNNPQMSNRVKRR